MPDNIKEILQHSFPFMVAASSGADKVNLTRIFEAVLIAALTGLGAWLLIIPELKIELRHVSDDVQDVRNDIKSVRGELKQVQLDVVKDRFTRTDFEAWRANHDRGEG